MDDSFDFDAYLTAMCGRISYYCAAIVGSAEAEDAAQEAFLRLWQNLGRISDERAASAFLYRTAYRVSVDMLRKRKRRETAAAEYSEGEPSSENPLSQKMLDALLMLPPTDRAVLYSRAAEECTYAEIAERFGKKESWARKRYSLARQKLAKILGKETENE